MYITNDKLQLKKIIIIKYVTVVQYSGIHAVIGKELRLTIQGSKRSPTQ